MFFNTFLSYNDHFSLDFNIFFFRLKFGSFFIHSVLMTEWWGGCKQNIFFWSVNFAFALDNKWESQVLLMSLYVEGCLCFSPLSYCLFTFCNGFVPLLPNISLPTVIYLSYLKEYKWWKILDVKLAEIIILFFLNG